VLVTDFDMPGIDGVELAQTVKALYPETRILMITGSTDYVEDVACIPQIDAVIAKPFSLDELTRTVDALLGGHEEGTALAA